MKLGRIGTFFFPSSSFFLAVLSFLAGDGFLVPKQGGFEGAWGFWKRFPFGATFLLRDMGARCGVVMAVGCGFRWGLPIASASWGVALVSASTRSSM